MRLVPVAVVALLVFARPARAFTDSVIDEVMAGIGGMGGSGVQYVEIRMRSAGQNDVAGSRIAFFKCDGSSVIIPNPTPITTDVPNGTAGGHWLMASATFAAAAGITPDFVVPGAMTTSSDTYPCGMVCWGKPTSAFSNPANYVDCVAYGGYSGSGAVAPPAFSGTPAPASKPAGDGTMSLTRISDTHDNATDFVLAPPTPTNNAGQVGLGGATTTTTTPGGSTTTAPGTTTTTFPPALATPLAGSKLVLKTSPKNAAKKSLAFVAHGTAIALGDPVGHGGGTVRVFTTAGDAFDDTYPLAASKWKSIAKGKGFRYVDPSGAIRTLVVKQGKVVKLTGLGGQLMHTLASNPDPVHVFVVAGTEAYCAVFPGGHFVAGKRYVAAASPAPASCP